MTMVDKMACAIAQSFSGWAISEPSEKSRRAALAAIEAMREVPDEYLGIHPLMDMEVAKKVRAQYTRVIDAALREK